ncbi:uncharacterized protein LOC110720784 [Chenopodium quinoa]|uniref:uncharacterized protein LOC110720784 n=1 Tax=Chenopodium quinoa TaxID=63459 RepID=UPI000B786D00|nr:uncharacterized protein LOC110720784 [Chenopodium quinoa]
MKILSWNAQGLGNPRAERALRNLCWRERPKVVFLTKTMLDATVLERIKRRCGFEHDVCLSSDGRSSGMGFWWREVDVSTVSFSKHYYAADILNEAGMACWRAIGVYGWSEAENKHKTWDMMRTLKNSCSIPCIMFRDFNEIMSIEEKEGGVVRRESVMDAFRDVIDECGLHDLGFKGNKFTWQRDRTPETTVRERVCCDSCKGMEYGCGAEAHTRIAGYAAGLKKWAAKTFRDIRKKIKKLEDALQSAQCAPVDAAMLSKCNELSSELGEMRRMEELYWYVRSRANEMRDGDENTAYFHCKASARKKKSTIHGLLDSSGNWCTDEQEIRAMVGEYFANLFSTSSPVEMEVALDGLEQRVTGSMNNVMNAESSDVEIKDTLFQMHPNKAPDVDGMHALCFQKFWHIVGPDIITLVKNWWNGNVNIDEINRTCIVLIPKCNDPKDMTKFRPISCCNVVYKTISKVLANKIKPFLDDIIFVN